MDFLVLFQTLGRWILTVKNNYRNVIYHNWRHAFNVAQSMFAMLHVSYNGGTQSQLTMIVGLGICIIK